MSDESSNYWIKINPLIKSGEKTIRHIVISGGGLSGFTYYGAIRELEKQKYWKLENIKTMHGTSVGSLMSFILALGYDWSDIDDYFIKRPWLNVFKITTYHMIESVISKMGMYHIKIYEDCIQPLFAGKDISINITMQEFFDLNGIEIHSFTTELNTFQLIDMSYKTHPNWRVIDVIYCSCCLPIIFMPFINENCAYGDGGFLSNYPLPQAIEKNIDPDEILGIYRNKSKNIQHIHSESSVFDYFLLIMNHLLERMLECQKKTHVGIECALPSTSMSLTNMMEAITNQQERKRIIELGVDLMPIDNNSVQI
jgi:predicted acylesterase/phospholipase RssA